MELKARNGKSSYLVFVSLRGEEGSVIPVMMCSLSSCAEELGPVGGNIEKGFRNDQSSQHEKKI